MNMNVKLDGEDEQSVHFPNRATIALQSGPAAYINLNIVNPNLSNPGYILNPVSSVPQNLVAYQSPVTLQSYITLQEADGNIVNNLQVGVPVPIGLPVPAELLQNPNLVNTSIIIGNEDCNQPVIFKPATNNVSEPNDIKISYMPKPMIQELKSAVPTDDQNMRLTDLTSMNMENILKKPCPLEMSIKAANIDLEFEKCDPEDLIPEGNGLLHNSNYPVIQKLPIPNQLTENVVLNVPVKLNDKAIMDVPVVQEDSDAVKKPKTEITWESNSLQGQVTSNEFQESLICEVEEANEDEDDRGDEKNASSSDDNETLPLSVVLKLRRVQEEEEEEEDNDDGKSFKGNKKLKDSRDGPNKKTSKECDQVTVESQKRQQRSRKAVDHSDYAFQWSESDDEVLDLKRIKSEFNYNCYYEPNTGMSSESKKFLKVRHCCSKKECFKKITLKDQKIAHKHFYDLESAAKQDAYLINCIEHVQTSRSLSSDNTKENSTAKDKCVESDERTMMDAANIQLEIENESNGNQMLSDEIQKAIKESLKDCMINQISKDENTNEKLDKEGSDGEMKDSSDEEEEGKTQNWNYYLVIDRCRKKVCLQFLLKLFRITKNRIKNLQGKILSGQPLSDDSSQYTAIGETFDVWEFARIHLNTLSGADNPCCRSNPRHRFLNTEMSLERLFDTFKDFYRERVGKEVKVKINAYKRFIKNETNFSVLRNKPGSCSECDLLEEQGKKNKKGIKNAVIQNDIVKLDRSFQTRKKGRKKWEISTDSECSSDDEPLLKRKKLKLTISLKGNKFQNSERNDSTEEGRKVKKKTKKEVRARGNGVRGRDVWSLMLLHLETMPYKVCKSCVSRKRHRFFDASMTKQTLYEDYRRYFLKETNSELGLGFTMYEKYFDRNCGYTIGDVDVNSPICPRCALEPPKPETNKSNKKSSKNYNNNFRLTRHEEIIS